MANGGRRPGAADLRGKKMLQTLAKEQAREPFLADRSTMRSMKIPGSTFTTSARVTFDLVGTATQAYGKVLKQRYHLVTAADMSAIANCDVSTDGRSWT